MRAGARADVSLYIEAPPEIVYDLVSDVTRVGEWSPECRACEWIDDATGPEVGARFSGTNKRKFVRWPSVSRVVASTRGHEFSWITMYKGKDESHWSYRFERQGNGTLVTESFELLADMSPMIRFMERFVLGIRDRRADLEAGMSETLRRLKAACTTANPAATSS